VETVPTSIPPSVNKSHAEDFKSKAVELSVDNKTSGRVPPLCDLKDPTFEKSRALPVYAMISR
jgi:hypothetical protein